MMKKNLQKGESWGTRQVVAAALVLLLCLFLFPLLLLGDGTAAPPAQSGGTLPPLAPSSAAPSTQPSADSQVMVRLAMEGGEVVTLSMEEYLWRVVAAEMPASFELEALKAQATAARTYTLSKLGYTVQAHPEADVCTDISCCQAYIDPEQAAANWGASAQEYTAKIAAAVAQTDGMAILYQGQPIQAVFFSSADGRTVDAVEVWGNAVPYLTGVDSPEGEEVPNYHSTVTVPTQEFQETIQGKYPGANLSGDPTGWLGEVKANSAGGVEQMQLGGVWVSGTSLRTLFGLRSTSFTLSATAEEITFSVTGYGHGVGMSQYGANALAKQGKDYEQILMWYYTGVEVAPYAPK